MQDKQFAFLLRKVAGELSKRVANHDAERDRLNELQNSLGELLKHYQRDRTREETRSGLADRPERVGNAQEAMDVLRGAEQPLTTRQIAEAVLVQRHEKGEKITVRELIPGIAVALRRYARKGFVSDGGTFPAQWRVVRRDAQERLTKRSRA